MISLKNNTRPRRELARARKARPAKREARRILKRERRCPIFSLRVCFASHYIPHTYTPLRARATPRPRPAFRCILRALLYTAVAAVACCCCFGLFFFFFFLG